MTTKRTLNNSDLEVQALINVCAANAGVFDFQEFAIGEVIKEIARPGDVVVDGGAHLGRHTKTMLSSVGDRGRVYAIEPLPEYAQKIRLMAKESTGLLVIQKALASESGEESFTFVQNNPSLSGIKVSFDLMKYDCTEIPVATETLDSILIDENGCRLMKLDLEGAEYSALSGAQKILSKYAPLIVFENELGRTALAQGYDVRNFMEMLELHNYQLFDLLGNVVSEAHWSNERPCFDNFIAAKRPEDVAYSKKRLPQLALNGLVAMTSAISSAAKIFNEIVKCHAEKMDIVLFGAGNRARLITHEFELPFKFAVDNDPIKWGKKINGIDIVDPTFLRPLVGQSVKVVVISLASHDIVGQLQHLGFQQADIMIVAIG
ncbi:MAG: FkbM family methyltransferase [Sulfuritalea sp.]|jgi:FkbM family methyltransferase|nr:FkbM family methyltransferase [Sulfuritalea sp.]